MKMTLTGARQTGAPQRRLNASKLVGVQPTEAGTNASQQVIRLAAGPPEAAVIQLHFLEKSVKFTDVVMNQNTTVFGVPTFV